MRRALQPGIVLAWMLLACSSPAFALNPALDISQYAHTAWRIRDGFSKGIIRSIAQTPDGYLWLGTELGLLRFDGVRPVPWQPPTGQQLPSSVITRLLVTRDGALWIGTERGLAKWHAGKLTRYESLAGRYVGNFIEDHQGSIWAATIFKAKWTLCEIRPNGAECHGDDGGPGAGALSVLEDRTGQLWVGTAGRGNGLWRWRPGTPKFYPLPQQPNGINKLSEDADGALLIPLADGVGRFVDGEMAIGYRFPPSTRGRNFSIQLRDRDGGLWLGSGSGSGLVHFHEGITDTFTSSDGLSDDRVLAMFEDREGTIWVATVDGLDRFRDVSVATYTTKQGLSNASVASVLAASDGSIWLATADGVNRWNHGQVISYSEPAGAVQSIRQDSSKRVWVSTLKEVGYLEGRRFVPLKGVGGGPIRGIAEDSDSTLWIANDNLGLLRLSIRTGATNLTPWDRLKQESVPLAMVADRSLKGVWLGYRQGALVHFADGEVRATYGKAHGLGEGVRSLQLDRDGTLWAATDSGLSRVSNGRVATLTIRNGLPCDGVEWLVEDDNRALWLGTRCGLVRIDRAEISAWATSVDVGNDARQAIKTTVFDTADGVRTYIGISYFSQPAVKGSDGRVWFVSQGGVSVVDPRRLPFNSLPPPIHIEEVRADRKTYDAEASASRIILPALTRDLQIDYAALSLVVPERNRFKIMLEGWDREWQDMGNRRQAFYTNLPSRKYRFRVIASNNSGVWNEAGAALEFSVAPAYYQTLWFRLTMVAAALAFLAALYQLRLRRLAWQFNMRLEERVNERTRVARDLHDTLLQSFHAVVLRLQAVTFLPPAEAKKALENVIDDAGHAIVEARDAVQGLRSATGVSADLPSLIRALGEELIASHSDQRTPAISVNVEGSARQIVPLVRDEIYRIAREALRNAFRHADASRIQVEIRYAPAALRVRIRDDGKGLDQDVVDRGGRTGHYGLAGMRERAELVKGTLTLWSERGAGTEMELTIPASVAYD